MKQYYEAYDERYKAIHAKGCSWTSDKNTPIVIETIRKHRIDPSAKMLEIGCGEGRDAGFLLEQGFNLIATDLSPEAISYCKKKYPEYEQRFRIMNCLTNHDSFRYGFIFSVAVIHMLVLDEDRKAYYRFIHEHLSENGLALICTMGDGQKEFQTDIRDAFALQEREHPSGKVMVAATSCRTVSFRQFESELTENGLKIIEKGFAACMPDFNALMYAVVKRT